MGTGSRSRCAKIRPFDAEVDTVAYIKPLELATALEGPSTEGGNEDVNVDIEEVNKDIEYVNKDIE